MVRNYRRRRQQNCRALQNLCVIGIHSCYIYIYIFMNNYSWFVFTPDFSCDSLSNSCVTYFSFNPQLLALHDPGPNTILAKLQVTMNCLSNQKKTKVLGEETEKAFQNLTVALVNFCEASTLSQWPYPAPKMRAEPCDIHRPSGCTLDTSMVLRLHSQYDLFDHFQGTDRCSSQ